jgi:hypothetical protein
MGAWGSGHVDLQFETPPTADLRKSFSLVNSFHNVDVALWSNVFNCVEAMPPIAGLCIRQGIGLKYAELSKKLLSIVPHDLRTALTDGDDDLIRYTACKMGFGMGIFPEMRQTCIVSKKEANRRYLAHRTEIHTFIRYMMLYKWQGTLPPNPISLRGALDAFREFLLVDRFRRSLYFNELRGMLKTRRAITNAGQLRTHIW